MEKICFAMKINAGFRKRKMIIAKNFLTHSIFFSLQIKRFEGIYQNFRALEIFSTIFHHAQRKTLFDPQCTGRKYSPADHLSSNQGNHLYN
jgi:hypothetical protein